MYNYQEKINLDKNDINNETFGIIQGSSVDISQNIDNQKFYLPILMYHHIVKKESQNSYYVSPEIFDKQMAWLKANNYQVISYDTLYKALTSENSKLPSKAVVITFDDGVIDHYTNAFPILKKYSYTATFFIKNNNIGFGRGGMTWDMIRELVNAGMTIGSHSMNHDNMAQMNQSTLEYEIEESKKDLENNLGININYFCYPGGAHSDNTITALKNAGFLSATTSQHEVYHTVNSVNDLFKISRIHIDDELPTFIRWVQGKDIK